MPTPIDINRFSAGGYWDFRQLAGLDDDAQTASIASSVGSNVLTVVNSPRIDDVAIGGNRCLQLVPASTQYLRCDALASRFTAGNTWTAVIRARITTTSYNPLFAAGSSGSAINNYFHADYVNGTQAFRVATCSTGSGAITRDGSTNMEFDEHTIMLCCDGTNLYAYIDGAAEALSIGTMDPNAIVCDRFVLGAYLSTALSLSSGLFLQFFAFSNECFTSTDAANMFAQLVAGDATLAPASCKQIAPCGDSITATSVYTAQTAGNREYLIQWITDHRLSVRLVGQYQQGSLPNRHCVAQGGNNMQTIAAHFATALADPTFLPDIVRVQMGTNDMSNDTMPATQAAHLATFRTYINQMRNNAHTAGLNPKFVVTTIPPFSTVADGGISQINGASFNAGLQAATTGEFAVFAAAFPGELVATPDFNAALGSAWSLLYYDSYPTPGGIPYGTAGSTADSTHPNEYGVQAMGAAEIVSAGLAYRALSSTLIGLSCVIKSAPGVAASTTLTISGRCTRYPSTVVVKLNGVALGSAVMSKRGWTFTGTAPYYGGTFSLTAVITDTLSGETFTSASFPLTITGPAMANSLFDSGRQKLLEGSIAWLTDSIKFVLVRGYTPNLATHVFLSDITGGGGGTLVATSANAASKTSSAGVADCADPVFSAVAAGAACSQVVCYKDTGVAGTSPLIGLLDTATGLPCTPNGQDITVTLDNGALKLFKL